MSKPQAVIFDIGNVLIEWHPDRFYDRAIGRERREAMFAAIDLLAMNEEIDRGAHCRDTVYAEADKWPDWTPEIRMWHDRWIEMITPVIDHSVRLLRALRRKGVPVFALSNFGVQTLEIAQENYPFLEEFDRRYISGHMGVIKPEPEIYRMVEADCGFPPETLLFADDLPANIAAATARGWQTHLFDGPGPWADRLVSEGLLDAEDAI